MSARNKIVAGRDPHVDNLPLQLPDSMSLYEKESRDAEA
jgi:hypothetical protein